MLKFRQREDGSWEGYKNDDLFQALPLHNPLSAMSVDELKEYAEQRGINIPGTMSRHESILKFIQDNE